ncbi:D-ribose ABC transporter substrate-binding protein [Fodinisporobacter ferrooxydans]|uniref:D-ribose ABC transporter substrate-binding protein n=1 Tax=Fodinisporobacter ferrooxydans TaxID=2901836 RepID=A0ABY4CGY4_9BACL|nr:D-ribose ABC transporter substrate-binding protein [Alicyclobacillaceae bacterium MYW30-H2]
MKKQMGTLALAGILSAGLLAGCGSQQNSSTQTAKDTSTQTSKSGKTIGFVVSTLNNPFFVAMRDGAQAEATKLGVKLLVEDGNNDPSSQLNQIQNLIQQKVDAIILNPASSQALSSAVQMANQAKIPVITLDRSVDSGKVATFIASDNIKAGKMAADQLIQALKGKGSVVELQGVIGTSAERDREKGFDEEIATASGIKVVAKQPADFDRTKALNVMQNILQANPNIKGVFAQNDEMALGSLKAIQAANKKGIAIVGIDGEKEAINNVQNGSMLADIAQQPSQEGALGVDNALKVIEGKSVPSTIASPLQLVVKGTQFSGF